MAELDFNQLSPEEQQRQALQVLMNSAQGALLQGYQPDMSQYEFKKPDNIGQAFGNVLKNRVVNPIKEQFGFREPLSRVVKKMQIAGYQDDQAETALDQLMAIQLRQSLQAGGISPEDIDGLSREELAQIKMNLMGPSSTDVYGNVTTTNPLTGEQKLISSPPTSVQEYNLGVSQTKPPMRKPTYFERQDQAKKGTQSIPSAVQTFQFLTELNPEILSLKPEEQEEYLFKIIRQDPVTAGEIAKAQRKAAAGGLYLTRAQEKVDELFAGQISNFRIQGGQTTALSRLQEFDEIIGNLESNPGQITGLRLSAMPRIARPVISIDTQDRVERIITEGLRVTLGAAFTAEEAKQFIARSYNIMLPESVNADRLRRVRAAMQRTTEELAAAGNYYDEKGSLQGFKGLPTLQSLEKGLYKVSDYKGLTNEQLMTRIDDPSISRDEFDILLRVAQMRKVQ